MPERIASIASLESLLNVPTGIEPLQKFLRFRCGDTELLVAVEDVIAVRTISVSDLLPVPQMPVAVLGLCNWRGEALWLVDLAQQLNLGSAIVPIYSLTTLIAIVVQSNNTTLALVVSEIDEIEQHNPTLLLHPLPNLFSPSLIPFVQGYFPQDCSIVLNVAAVIQDSALQIHPFALL